MLSSKPKRTAKAITTSERIKDKMSERDIVKLQTKFIAKNGIASFVGKKECELTGSLVEGERGAMAGSTHGPTKIENLLLEFIQRDFDIKGDRVTTSTTVTKSSVPTAVKSKQGPVCILSGVNDRIDIIGSVLQSSQAVIFKGKKLNVRANIAV